MGLRVLVLTCFFLSGATGLLYQVLWTRLLGSVIGNTHFSFTIVVSVFMGGLALGSWLGGRLAVRSRDPLRLYGLLILALGALCLSIPFAIDLVEPVFHALYEPHDGTPEAFPLVLARLAFCTLVLLPPTTCMGCTLPVLSQHLTTRLSHVGWSVGSLYTVNTFGACLGAYLTGFFLLRQLGLSGTTWLAVAIDFAIGIVILLVARNAAGTRNEPPPVERETAAENGEVDPYDREESRARESRRALPLQVRLAVWAFALSGFANMMLQNAWIKSITQTIGNSTYAFTIIVTLFIFGIGVGGLIFSLLADRIRNLELALGIVITLTGIAVSVTVPVLGVYPAWGARWFDRVAEPSYGTFLAIKLALVSLLILPSTILMGCVFPIVGKIRTRSVESVGSAIGSAYFANTLGAILGTLASGFLFIPLLGRVYWTLYLGAGISLAMGLVLVGGSMKAARPIRLALPLGVFCLLLLPHWFARPFGVLSQEGPYWDPEITSRGAWLYYEGSYWKNRRKGEVREFDEFIRLTREQAELLSYHEGVHAPIAVLERRADATRGQRATRTLRISGKADASIALDDYFNRDLVHQLMAAHLPMVLHPNPERILTLGLGGGVTLGALTTYPIERVDSLEIAPEVIDAAREYFSSANRGALEPDHPLVRNVIGDGRNHLQFTPSRYDVFTSVPSNPWIAGMGNLFTREFFEIARSRLKPDGLMCQWIHKISMRPEDYRTVLRTFLEVFGDHTQLWDLDYDCLLIGALEPVRFDAKRLEQLLENPEIARDLSYLGIVDGPTLLRQFEFDAQGLRRFVGRGALHTDDCPVLEFDCPRGLYGYAFDVCFELCDAMSTPIDGQWISGLDAGELERARNLQVAFAEYQLLEARNIRFQDSLPDGPTLAEKVARIDPADRQRFLDMTNGMLATAESLSDHLEAASDPWLDRHAAKLTRGVLRVKGPLLDVCLCNYHRAIVSKAQGEALEHLRRESSEKVQIFGSRALERAIQYGDVGVETAPNIALIGLSIGAQERAVELLTPLAEKHPENAEVIQMLGVVQAASGDSARALTTLTHALELARPNAQLSSVVHQNLARLHRDAGRLQQAVQHYEAALQLNPQNLEARRQLTALRAPAG